MFNIKHIYYINSAVQRAKFVLGRNTCTARLTTLVTSKHYLKSISIFLKYGIGPQNLSTHGTLISKHTHNLHPVRNARDSNYQIRLNRVSKVQINREMIFSQCKAFPPSMALNVSGYLLFLVFEYRQVHK
jgi:hypothetical protein